MLRFWRRGDIFFSNFESVEKTSCRACGGAERQVNAVKYEPKPILIYVFESQKGSRRGEFLNSSAEFFVDMRRAAAAAAAAAA
jgi:hypothetical protein